MWLTLLPLFANVALQVLGSTGVLSPANSSLANNLLASVIPFLGTITSKQGTTADVLAGLSLLSSTLAALKSQTNLPADKLAEIEALSNEVQKAILAYIQAGHGYDPTLYAPIGVIA